jgi:hypothetical protein
MLLYFMLRVISSVIMLLSVGIVVAGCSESYTPLTRAIAKEELIGVWRPTPESKAFLAREKIPFSDETLKLELRANGSFDLPGIPDCWLAPFGDCHGTVLNVSGTWSTYQEKEGTPSRLHLLIEQGAPRVRVSLPLANTGSSISIPFVFGDADSDRAIIFQK